MKLMSKINNVALSVVLNIKDCFMLNHNFEKYISNGGEIVQ